MSRADRTLPERFRITRHCVWIDPMDPYDSGDWVYFLEQWGTRTVGHWWWKRPETSWWTVEKSWSQDLLVQTAWLMEKNNG